MAELFWNELYTCIAKERRKGPTADLSLETWQTLQEDFPCNPPAPASSAEAEILPEPAMVSAPVSFASQAKSGSFSPAPVQVQAPAQVPASAAGLPDNWDDLYNIVMQCRNCPLAERRTHVVFGEGNLQADLMFIGEGPGRDEDLSGRPFVGAAGQLLDKMIAAMQFTREEVYIANIVKCRPPNNRNPEAEEAAVCIGYLEKQIELVSPKVIVLLGAVALKHLLKLDGLRRHRGNWLTYRDIPVMATFHPASLLRSPSDKRYAWSDLQQVMRKFGKTYPANG